jgi:hypothetical protein
LNIEPLFFLICSFVSKRIVHMQYLQERHTLTHFRFVHHSANQKRNRWGDCGVGFQITWNRQLYAGRQMQGERGLAPMIKDQRSIQTHDVSRVNLIDCFAGQFFKPFIAKFVCSSCYVMQPSIRVVHCPQISVAIIVTQTGIDFGDSIL